MRVFGPTGRSALPSITIRRCDGRAALRGRPNFNPPKVLDKRGRRVQRRPNLPLAPRQPAARALKSEHEARWTATLQFLAMDVITGRTYSPGVV